MSNQASTSKRFLLNFVVEGDGDFPIDMLRYDAAFPATESDSYAITRNYERRQVKLQAWIVNGARVPTPERWASFLWKVVK